VRGGDAGGLVAQLLGARARDAELVQIGERALLHLGGLVHLRRERQRHHAAQLDALQDDVPRPQRGGRAARDLRLRLAQLFGGQIQERELAEHQPHVLYLKPTSPLDEAADLKPLHLARGREVLFMQALDELKPVAQLGGQALWFIANDRQAAASLRTIRRKSSDDRLPARPSRG